MKRFLLLVLIPILLIGGVGSWVYPDFTEPETVIDWEQKYWDLKESYNTLLNEKHRVGHELAELRVVYDDLENIFYLNRQQYELSPSSDNGVNLFPLPLLNEMRITFPDAQNCGQGWRVSGDSMKPLISSGSEIIGNTCFTESDIGVGDLIVFMDDVATFHQIIDITNEGYVTKGTFNDYADKTVVSFDDILAIVVAIIY